MSGAAQENVENVDLRPYVARLALEIAQEDPAAAPSWAEVEGTLAFFDISGFTKLTERLSVLGRGGAEVMGAIINDVFVALIDPLLAAGGDVLKFGGDALVVLFRDEDHTARAASVGAQLQRVIFERGRVATPAGPVRLRMSAGIHCGRFLAMLTRTGHRELLLAGPDVTRTVEMESAARAGQVMVSPELAGALPPRWTHPDVGPGRRLRLSTVPVMSLEGERESEPLPEIDLSSLIPVPLRSRLGRGEAGDHRPVAVAFLAVPGTDELLAAAGSAALVARLDAVAAGIDAACCDLGVCWLKSDIGPSQVRMVLTAGAPNLSEHDDERILRAVRVIGDRCPGLKVGANAGAMFAGDVGHPARRAYDLMGDAVNLAARLMARAEPGTILVSDTMLGSAGHFGASPLPAFAVKGKRRLVAASRLGALKVGGSGPGTALPLLGRADELALLRSALATASSGSGRSIELVGEAGIGKSRLVAELRDDEAGVSWLEARGEPYQSSSAYHPVRVMLRGLPDIEGAVRQLVERDPDFGIWLPLLDPLLGTRLPTTPEVERLDPAFVRLRRHETTVALLERILEGPVVLLMDDLHWFDDASRDLAQHLIEACRTRPWLVLVTTRPGRPSLGVGVRLELESLDAAASRQLALDAVEDFALSEEVLRRVGQRAAGNPLFVRELVAAVQDGAELPESLERVIGARIDQLGPNDRRLLREAAVAGGTFDIGRLAGVIGQPAAATPLRWAVLAPFVTVDETEARFRHDLIRAVAYEGLAHHRRRELHGRWADSLAAETSPDGAETEAKAALLAHHYRDAHRPDQAWRWAVVAADASQRSAAWVEAAELYGTALDAAARLSGLVPADVAGVAQSLGDVCERLGRHEDAMSAYRRCRSLLRDDPVATARVLRKEGRVEEKTGHYSSSLRRFSRALRVLELLPASPEVTAAQVEARLGYSVTRFFQGRLQDSIDLALAVLTDAEGIGDRRALAQAYLQLEMACSEGRRPERAEYGRRALTLFEELGDDLGLGNLLLNLGVSEYNASQWDRALECYRRAGEAYERAGDVVGAASTFNNEAEILTDQGRYAEAAERLTAARRAYRAARYSMGVALTTSGRARLALRAGDLDLAAQLLADARTLFSELGATNFVVDTDVRMVEHLVFARRPGEALALASTTGLALDRLGAVAILPISLERLRAWAFSQLGRGEEASVSLTAALGRARAEDVPYEVALCLRAGLEINGPDDRNRRDEDEHEVAQLASRLGIVDLPVPPPG